jgi:hypothetical protein
MRVVVGFANKHSPFFEGFNELTIKVLTEETQEFCACGLCRSLNKRRFERVPEKGDFTD